MTKRRGKLIKWGFIGIFTMLVVVLLSQLFSSEPHLRIDSNSNSPTTDRKLTIWWEQGLNFDDDEAIRQIITAWEEETGKQVKLSFFPVDSLISKAERAWQAGTFPDILMASKAERVLYPRLAWHGCLEEVNDILQPIKEDYPHHILRGVTYFNAQNNRYSYYGIPIHQATMSIFYWQDLLSSIDLNSRDIPPDWSGFWQFWQNAQTRLNLQEESIYGLGLPLADNENSDDTHYLFEQILEAFNVDLIDEGGGLNISSEDRQGIINSLTWYANIYKGGYIPPQATEWSNTDNNLNLLNKSVLMTPNGSLSISAGVKKNSELYNNQLAIAEFPRKPSDEPMRYPIFIRQAVIYKDSPNKSQAKDFLRYLIQPEITKNYLKATGDRNQPVQNSLWQDSYWQNSSDPYLANIAKILTSKHAILSPIAENPAYSQVLRENIWGKTLTQIIKNQLSPEKATDLAIVRIKEIFAEWAQENSLIKSRLKSGSNLNRRSAQ